MAGWHIPLNRVTGTLTGTLSGVMGTSSGIGAPPLALLYQDQPAGRIRATLAILCAGATLIMLAMLFGFGEFGAADIRLGLLLVSGVAAVGLILRSL